MTEIGLTYRGWVTYDNCYISFDGLIAMCYGGWEGKYGILSWWSHVIIVGFPNMQF